MKPAFFLSLLLLTSCANVSTSSSSALSSSSIESISSSSEQTSSSEESSSEEPSFSSSEEVSSSSSEESSSSSEEISSSSEEPSSSAEESSSYGSDESSSIDSSGYESMDTSEYYDSLDDTLQGAELKTALHNLIKGHTDRGYKYAWTAYETTDVDDDGKIIDIYSSYHYDPKLDHNGTYKNEGDGFNREHIVPQNVFYENTPMKSDLHHLLPTDGHVNNVRNNYPHAETSTSDYVSSNGCIKGDSATAGVTGTVFEVIDEYKGDVARIYFYMVTRYEDKLTSWKSFAAFDHQSFPGLSSWAIDLYLRWSDEDPVSTKEIKRNDKVFELQNNRNPFIDHPEFAHQIWDTPEQD